MANSEHRLLDSLRSRNERLAQQASRLIGESHRFLEYSVSTFPGGTDHTARHTNTVEQITGMLLSDAFLAELSDHELFFLTVVCHYHDLAMAGTEADDLTPERREQVRRDHAIRIGSIVRQQWAELGFEDERTAQILGEICRGHRPQKNSEGDANWDELNSVEVFGPGVSVRVRLLSALIYAIDELHLGADRAPARVQAWREIRDEESRRHQAINGPCASTVGLLFQVNADTPGFEENLRTHVFRKALAAVRDLRRQAEAEGIKVALPQIVVHWDRRGTWDTLLPLVCADLNPRAKDEIVQALPDSFAELASAHTSLNSLGMERGNAEDELRTGACRCVEDAITCRHLVEAGDAGDAGDLVLSSAESIADTFFSRMREADPLDRLFLGRYQARWEEDLFESQYGRTYVASCVLPAVERSYSVPLTNRPDTDPLRITLETCPTAARLVRAYGPPPSNLVKESLLASAALSGALFDLHADPERLLDRRVRSAVQSLAAQNLAVMPTLRLLEEMALVGGFTFEQLQDAHTLSDAAHDALHGARPPDQPAFNIGLTQTFPTDAPAATQLPRLLLASQRSGTPINLTDAPGLSLRIRLPPEAGLPEPTMFGVGPGEPISGGPSRLPARIEVNKTSKTVRFYMGRFADAGPTTCPVVVTLPPPPRPGDQPTIRFGGSIQWSELTIRDLRSLVAANQVISRDGGCIELLIEEQGALLASMNKPRGGEMFALGLWTADVLRGFRGVDGSLAVPLFIPVHNIAELGALTASQRNSAWKEFRKSPPGGYKRVSSVFLRLSTDSGKPLEETFLQFFPFDLFPAPTVEMNETASMTTDEFTKRWEAGSEEFVLTVYFQSDVFELSRALREWCKSPSSVEFPFDLHSAAVNAPLTRSVLNIRFGCARDRGWHLDRAIVFDFRPMNRSESYQLEAAYWRSVNDDRRAELADEIRARLANS